MLIWGQSCYTGGSVFIHWSAFLPFSNLSYSYSSSIIFTENTQLSLCQITRSFCTFVFLITVLHVLIRRCEWKCLNLKRHYTVFPVAKIKVLLGPCQRSFNMSPPRFLSDILFLTFFSPSHHPTCLSPILSFCFCQPVPLSYHLLLTFCVTASQILFSKHVFVLVSELKIVCLYF